MHSIQNPAEKQIAKQKTKKFVPDGSNIGNNLGGCALKKGEPSLISFKNEVTIASRSS